MKNTNIKKSAAVIAVLGLGAFGAFIAYHSLTSNTSSEAKTNTSHSSLNSSTPNLSSSSKTLIQNSSAYLPYISSDNELTLLNQQKPTLSISIIQMYSNMEQPLYTPLIVFDSYNSSNYTYTGLEVKELDFISNSRLMKIPLTNVSSTPTPVQISSFTDISSIQNSWDDPINGVNYMVVDTMTSGSYFVNSKMTSTDNPIHLNNKKIVASLGGTFTNPSITGFLVSDKHSLNMCDTNLNNCKQIYNNPDLTIYNVSYMGTDPSNNSVLLCLSVGPNSNIYSLNGTTLKNTGGVCGMGKGIVVADNKAVYQVSSLGDLSESPFSNLSQLKTIYSRFKPYNNKFWTSYYGSMTEIVYFDKIIGMTQNYIIGKDSMGDLLAVSKNSSSSIILFNHKSHSGENFSSVISLPNAVIFNLYNKNQSLPSACVWNDGSPSVTCTPNSYWAGEIFARSGTVNVSASTVDFSIPNNSNIFSFDFAPYKLLKVVGVSNPNNSSGGGGTLTLVNPSNLNQSTSLCSIPNGYFFASFEFGIGNTMLTRLNTKQSYNGNVFFLNISQPTGFIPVNNVQNIIWYVFPIKTMVWSFN